MSLITKEEKSDISVNLLSSNIFNKEKGETIEWRFLTDEQRIEHIDAFFKREFNNLETIKSIDQNTKMIIFDLAKKGKMKLKKEITYDSTNERIITIHALVPEQYTDNYVYKPEILIKKEKSKKVARNLLFRKKK